MKFITLVLGMVVIAVAVMAAAQAPAQRPKWEAVSIKPCVLPPGQRGGGVSLSAGRMAMNCQPVSAFIAWAYILYADGQNHPFYSTGPGGTPMEGGPSWIRSDRYTINAKPEGTPGKAMMQGPMLQAILEDRFNLKLHAERREVPVYELTVAKGGSKLQRFAEGTCIPIDSSKTFEDQPEISKTQRRCPGFVTPKPPNLQLDSEGTSVEDFAHAFLSLFVDRRIVDRTGLNGLFSFHLEFALPATAADTAAAADTSGPSIFTALQEQLGLKLESAKGRGEFLIIDHVERPTEN
jgi:uncharacterized protein (TIGR03435 family)